MYYINIIGSVEPQTERDTQMATNNNAPKTLGYGKEAKELAASLCKQFEVDGNLTYMSKFIDNVKQAADKGQKMVSDKVMQDRDKTAAYSYWLPTVSKFIHVFSAAEGKGSRSAEAKRVGLLRADLNTLLASCGVKPANAKRYIENARGALLSTDKACAGLAHASTEGPNSVTAWFADNDVETETAIKKLWAGPEDKVKALAQRVSKLKAADRRRFNQLVARFDRDAQHNQAKADLDAKQRQETAKVKAKASKRKKAA